MIEQIVILDFGSQYTQVIARRVRECNVYSVILRYDTPAAEIAKLAHRNASSLKQAALELGYATADELDLWLNPASMLGQR